ncbi:selenium binding protein [Mammaliicoccus sciuri]|uniref:selenium binding protein n=1 Tax=Mammaliicoccus sciuri TaxID=1296 RepID=UPI002DBF993C|nr:selenium binding protein [Mammaliicoccus sciuri]MEB8206559.1 selenium binding protein [Mammaliicoccus sciuri]
MNNITRQAIPSREYRELIGTAICVFNSNNSFIIENILSNDLKNKYNWYELTDKTSGELSKPIKETISSNSNKEIASLFADITYLRNRIVHSYQITSDIHYDYLDENKQILCTKYKDHTQKVIDKEFLLNFIELNELLSEKLHKYRGY